MYSGNISNDIAQCCSSLFVTLTDTAHAHASITYGLYKVHAHTTTGMQQSHMRTLTRNVVPASGFAVFILELLATTSGHEVPLPVYSSAMLQAVSPCSSQTTEHPIHRSCYNSGTRKCTAHTSHETLQQCVFRLCICLRTSRHRMCMVPL